MVRKYYYLMYKGYFVTSFDENATVFSKDARESWFGNQSHVEELKEEMVAAGFNDLEIQMETVVHKVEKVVFEQEAIGRALNKGGSIRIVMKPEGEEKAKKMYFNGNNVYGDLKLTYQSERAYEHRSYHLLEQHVEALKTYGYRNIALEHVHVVTSERLPV